MISSDITLSIIIVSYNTAQVTIDCISSIYAADWKSDFEIIVIDNNSHDDSVERIKREFPQVRLIENPDNKLFSIANNQGAKIAKGKYLLLLNSDTLVSGDNLQRMIDFFETCPKDVICIGPKILNADGTLQSCGYPSSGALLPHIASLFHLNRILPLHVIDATLDRNPNRTHRAGWVSGACMMMPRDLYNQIGGLNEKLIFYGEEPEFGYRTRKLGYKTIYFSDASIIHLGGVSTKKDIDKEVAFEKDIAQYNSLIQLTIGAKKAIRVAWWTRLSYKLKRIFHPDKAYFDERIVHETKVMKYFKSQLVAKRRYSGGGKQQTAN